MPSSPKPDRAEPPAPESEQPDVKSDIGAYVAEYRSRFLAIVKQPSDKWAVHDLCSEFVFHHPGPPVDMEHRGFGPVPPFARIGRDLISFAADYPDRPEVARQLLERSKVMLRLGEDLAGEAEIEAALADLGTVDRQPGLP